MCFSSRLASIQRTCRRCLTSTLRRTASWASDAATSSRSWTTPTPTGGKALATARRACSRATTSRQSTKTCDHVTPVNQNIWLAKWIMTWPSLSPIGPFTPPQDFEGHFRNTDLNEEWEEEQKPCKDTEREADFITQTLQFTVDSLMQWGRHTEQRSITKEPKLK